MSQCKPADCPNSQLRGQSWGRLMTRDAGGALLACFRRYDAGNALVNQRYEALSLYTLTPERRAASEQALQSTVVT